MSGKVLTHQPLFISVVQAPDAQPKARLWLNSHIHPLSLRLGLQMVMPETTPVLPALSRQNTFGSDLRNAARHLKIGIVGLGGIGMLVAEQLARAGFCRFVLIDHDRIEQTNLNRLPGYTTLTALWLSQITSSIWRRTGVKCTPRAKHKFSAGT